MARLPPLQQWVRHAPLTASRKRYIRRARGRKGASSLFLAARQTSFKTRECLHFKAQSRALPPALLHPLIVAAPTRIAGLEVPIALEKEEAVVAPAVVAANEDV